MNIALFVAVLAVSSCVAMHCRSLVIRLTYTSMCALLCSLLLFSAERSFCGVLYLDMRLCGTEPRSNNIKCPIIII
jgi:hypothetical protein